MAVRHISQDSNFNRFLNTVVVNLQNQFPEHTIGIDSPIETIKTTYTTHMSSDGEYGTMAELCALSEIFRFTFYVIRQSNHTEFVCYDYGSAVSQVASTLENKSRPVAHLLFTGDMNSGHFRVLNPVIGTSCTNIRLGNYKLIDEFTSSKLTRFRYGFFYKQY